MLKRQLRPEDVTCPAGSCCGDAKVYCGVEGSAIDGRENPDSIASYCAGDHTACPSWRAEKEAIAAGHGGVLAKIEAERPSDAERQQRQLQRARTAHAERLLRDPGPDGERFRAKVRRRLAALEAAA